MSQTPHPHSRRTMLVASTAGISGWSFGRPAAAVESVARESSAANGSRAKSTILFFLCGGASHIDMWDLKPDAPREYRGLFEPIATTAPGITLCEHLPLLAQQAHHLALVNSVGASVSTNDHHAGYYYNLTGHPADPTFLSLGNNRTPMPDDWPYLGTVAASRRPRHPSLPNAVTLPYMPSRKPYTRPGQFAARLGVEHDPLYLQGSHETPLKFHAPSLELLPGTEGVRLTRRHELLTAIDEVRREIDDVAATRTWSRQQQRAFELLSASTTAAAFDVAGEPESVRQRYGENVNGMSLLLARRLVEAGVPFITVFWMVDGINSPLAKKCKSAGGWDTHGNNFGCLKEDLLPRFDRCFSALVADLADRGLLDETLLLITSEMGRKPKIGDPRSGGNEGAGRDHWTHCLTDVLAGGGVSGGQTYGSSDRYAEYPADKPVTPADVAKTVYHAMGIDDLTATDAQGRPYNLLAEGEPLRELF
ncbi:MAG: DUF1501 domain-containing protein [Planctomycetaceae bacterium]|nr:DUF1501 domain-containing protein [Planctomycetaceae bacterium]